MSTPSVRASRLMGRRLVPVSQLARDRARARGEGLLRTSPRGGRPPLSPEERRRRVRESRTALAEDTRRHQARDLERGELSEP